MDGDATRCLAQLHLPLCAQLSSTEMQPPDECLWRRTPGWESDDSGSEAEENEEDDEDEEMAKRAAEHLEEVAGILGDRWLDVPLIDFEPVEMERSAPSKQPSQQPRPLPPSKWGNAGPPPCFRMEMTRAPIVKETLNDNGMQQTRGGQDWIVMWSGPRMREKMYHGLHELQRVNHFPGSTELTRKDRLCVHFNKMARRFGSNAFNFVPETYVLPRQIDEFLNQYENTKNIWIVKPHASSQGRGIFLLRDLDQLPVDEVSVVSRYVDNPLLIQGLKFDLRVYVLVTSFEPLRAYVYREGLTRFASKPFSTEDGHLEDAYRHLTNYSINKNAKNFVENQELKADNVGHKWSFSALNKHFKVVGIDANLMWSRIMDIILKTLISVRPNIAAETRRSTIHSNNCFELYGFDILVDQDLKPWLLEVNLSPSMVADSPLDRQVKSAVLSETFNLVGISHPSWKALATARLRSQMAQMRHSASAENGGPLSPLRGSAMAHALAGANRLVNQGANGLLPANAMFNRLASAGCLPVAAENAEGLEDRTGMDAPDPASAADGQNSKQGETTLEDLSERDLKSIAHALREVGRMREPDRCPNFIRLYPTRATTGRYAPIMRSQVPCCHIMHKMLFGEDAAEDESSDADEAYSDEPDVVPAGVRNVGRLAEAEQADAGSGNVRRSGKGGQANIAQRMPYKPRKFEYGRVALRGVENISSKFPREESGEDEVGEETPVIKEEQVTYLSKLDEAIAEVKAEIASSCTKTASQLGDTHRPVHTSGLKVPVDAMLRESSQPAPQRPQASFLPSLASLKSPPPVPIYKQAGRPGPANRQQSPAAPAFRQRTPPPVPPVMRLMKLSGGSRSLPALTGASGALPPMPMRSKQPPPPLRQLLAAQAQPRHRRGIVGAAASGVGAIEADFRSSHSLSSKLAGIGLKPLPQSHKMTADFMQDDIEF